jgi:hypothetical protein
VILIWDKCFFKVSPVNRDRGSTSHYFVAINNSRFLSSLRNTYGYIVQFLISRYNTHVDLFFSLLEELICEGWGKSIFIICEWVTWSAQLAHYTTCLRMSFSEKFWLQCSPPCTVKPFISMSWNAIISKAPNYIYNSIKWESETETLDSYSRHSSTTYNHTIFFTV